MYTKSVRNRSLWTAALLLGGVLGAGALQPGDRFPDPTAAGVQGRLPALAGQVVLVDFWASWCGPCKASFPILDQLYQRYRPRGLLVLAVSVDERAEDMRAFLAEHPVSFPVVHDAAQKLVAQVGVETMPTSVLVDRQGRVLAVYRGFQGAASEKALIAELDRQLPPAACAAAAGGRP